MLLFSDMMPRNRSCRVWRNRLGTTVQEDRREQHTADQIYTALYGSLVLVTHPDTLLGQRGVY